MRKGDFQKTSANEQAGRLVRALRRSLELTQAQFASYLHVELNMPAPSQAAVSAWEAGEATVPGPILVHAFNRLGVEAIAFILAQAVPVRNLTSPYVTAPVPIAA